MLLIILLVVFGGLIIGHLNLTSSVLEDVESFSDFRKRGVKLEIAIATVFLMVMLLSALEATSILGAVLMLVLTSTVMVSWIGHNLTMMVVLTVDDLYLDMEKVNAFIIATRIIMVAVLALELFIAYDWWFG